ncbi:MAG: transcription elongation factor GreAB [Verrucomicrobia bacterium]|nr:transcription elongation factor GreAB [Verrucomicrobiota bacterium]
MNKTEIIDAIRMGLKKDFDTFRRASQQTRQSGSDDESKSDGKYDTQSTEANYLADGQAKQAQEVVQAAAAYDALEKRDFGKFDFIEVGALIELEINKQSQWFFLGPAYGGLEIYLDHQNITVITPDSPLGSQLINRRAGDHISSPAAGILSIS